MTIQMSASPSKEEFAAHINRSFHATNPEGQEFEVTLVEFRDEFDSDTQETFSLTFKAPADAPAEQSTYTLTSEGVGEQLIFLVPIGKDADALYYEAVYNRFKQ